MYDPCPYCSSETKRTTGQVVYPHRRDLWEREFIVCVGCDAYVGCRFDGEPYGPLANKELRKARRDAREAFDRLWRQGAVQSRAKAYSWLRGLMGSLTREECVIGKFNVEQCEFVVEKADEYWQNLVLERLATLVEKENGSVESG